MTTPDAARVGTIRRTLLNRVGAVPVEVDAAVHEPPEGRAPAVAVLLAHGAGSDLDAAVLVAAAEAIAAAGHLVVRVNLGYRQQRPSGPPPRAEASIDDLIATWRALQGLHDGCAWVLGGASYGGRVASMEAARVDDVAGVLCWSYPLHPPGRPDRLRVAHLSDVTAPVLVVQGTHDAFGGPDELEPHLATVAAPTTVVAVSGADHALHVPRTRSDDGATHRVAANVALVAPQVLDWLAALPGSRSASVRELEQRRPPSSKDPP